MKILFDENMPRKLRYRFGRDHEVVTVQELGWAAKSNGELLRLMLENGNDDFVSGDRKMLHEQNWVEYPIPVLLLKVRKNRYEAYRDLMPQIPALLTDGAAPGPHAIAAPIAETGV